MGGGTGVDGGIGGVCVWILRRETVCEGEVNPSGAEVVGP